MSVSIPFVDLRIQYHSLKPEMDAAIQDVLERGAFVLGPDLKNFEQNFAAYIGVKHAVGVASGTDALSLALRALDIGPGDEVITVANTYVATCDQKFVCFIFNDYYHSANCVFNHWTTHNMVRLIFREIFISCL